MNEWISVHDRLPKPAETVIATNGVRDWLVGWFVGLSGDDPTKWLWTRNRVIDVTYWMPKAGALPPVPEVRK